MFWVGVLCGFGGCILLVALLANGEVEDDWSDDV